MTNYEIRRAPQRGERARKPSGVKLAMVQADSSADALERYLRGEGVGKSGGHNNSVPTGHKVYERLGKPKPLSRPDGAAMPVRWINRQADTGAVRTELWAWPEQSGGKVPQPNYSKRVAYRVGFTGTQHGMTEPQRAAVQGLLESLQERSFNRHLLYGRCVGADDEAAADARLLGYRLIGYPARGLNDKRGSVMPEEERPEKPPLERNLDIVQDCIVLIAAPHTFKEQQRSGTWSTVRRARTAGRPYWIVWPDGDTEFHRHSIEEA